MNRKYLNSHEPTHQNTIPHTQVQKYKREHTYINAYKICRKLYTLSAIHENLSKTLQCLNLLLLQSQLTNDAKNNAIEKDTLTHGSTLLEKKNAIMT